MFRHRQFNDGPALAAAVRLQLCGHDADGSAPAALARAAADGLRLDHVGCARRQVRQHKHALLDTYNFQALGFYQKNGYKVFGRLTGFSGKHDRHYLHKELDVTDV